MNSIRLSIIIPVYNSEATISELSRKLLSQLTPEVEVIFVNDGSTDKSCDVLQEICSNSDQCILLNKPNGGASSARNAGLACCSGQYVSFVDSDDSITADYVDTLLALSHKNHDLFEFGATSISVPKLRYSVSLPTGDCSKVEYSHQVMLQNTNPPWNKMYRTRIIKDNGISFDDSMKIGEDLVFTVRFLAYVKHIYISDRCIYLYDSDSGGISKASNLSFFSDNAKMYKAMTWYNKTHSPVDLDSDIRQSMIRSMFRSIGLCKAAGYDNEEIFLSIKNSELFSVIKSKAHIPIRDLVRAILIRHKWYDAIRFIRR